MKKYRKAVYDCDNIGDAVRLMLDELSSIEVNPNQNNIIVSFDQMPDYMIDDYVFANCWRADGQFVYHSHFYKHSDIVHLMKRKCYIINVEVVEKHITIIPTLDNQIFDGVTNRGDYDNRGMQETQKGISADARQS